MIWLFFYCVSSLTCEENLDQIMLTDFLPRLDSYVHQGKGLDYISGYPECLSSKLTYSVIYWDLNKVPVASFGFCLPQTCTAAKAETHIQQFVSLNRLYNIRHSIKHTGLSVKFLDLSVTKPMPKVAYLFITCFLALMSLNIIGTFSTLCRRSDHFLKHFSIISNFRKLFERSKGVDNLDCIDGIRALTSITVIFFHALFFEVFYPIENRSEFNKSLSEPFFSFLISLSHTVDVFFLLSGFLMSFLTIKELQTKQKDFSWARFFIRRIIRYLPMFYFLIGFERATTGGLPPSIQLVTTTILNSGVELPWWHALLLIHNLFPSEDGCYLGWTWTTSIDFQFYVMCSLVLYLYYKNRTWGYSLAFFNIFYSISYAVILSFIYELSPSPIRTLLNVKQSNIVYIQPVPRLQVFAIGIVLGFLYFSASEKKSFSTAYEVKDTYGERFEKKCLKFVNEADTRWLFYCIGVVFLAFSMIGTHYLVLFGEDSVGRVTKSVWVGMQRTIFILGFSFFMLPLLLGHNKNINWVLRFKAFNLISRISYSLYLLHPLLFCAIYMTGSELFVWNILTSLNQFCGLFVISVIICTVLQVCVEAPILNLDRYYLGR